MIEGDPRPAALIAPPAAVMPKFVVIDHSITDLGGHHYGYAAHVLRAAERAGYQPVLATNRKFTNSANAAWPIPRVYEFDFWAELPAGRTRRFLRSIANWVCRIWADFRSRLLHKTRNATDNPPRPSAGTRSCSSKRSLSNRTTSFSFRQFHIATCWVCSSSFEPALTKLMHLGISCFGGISRNLLFQAMPPQTRP